MKNPKMSLKLSWKLLEQSSQNCKGQKYIRFLPSTKYFYQDIADCDA